MEPILIITLCVNNPSFLFNKYMVDFKLEEEEAKELVIESCGNALIRSKALGLYLYVDQKERDLSQL